MISQNIIEINGKMFQVKRKFKENRIKYKDVENGVNILKQYYHCDTMFKAQNLIWLCNEIKDTEYEEIK